MPEIKAIETIYNGYRFRSRLEARWAVFFDAMGIKYDYEPEGFSMDYGIRYLPDFALLNIRWRGQDAPEYVGKPVDKIYIEVKGVNSYSDIPYNDCLRIEMFASRYPLLVLGNIPQSAYDAMGTDWLFNFSLLDGDQYPCFFSKYNGEIWVCGPDHEEFWDKTSEKALALAKMARFEYGEKPITERNYR